MDLNDDWLASTYSFWSDLYIASLSQSQSPSEKHPNGTICMLYAIFQMCTPFLSSELLFSSCWNCWHVFSQSAPQLSKARCSGQEIRNCFHWISSKQNGMTLEIIFSRPPTKIIQNHCVQKVWSLSLELRILSVCVCAKALLLWLARIVHSSNVPSPYWQSQFHPAAGHISKQACPQRMCFPTNGTVDSHMFLQITNL